MFSVAPLLRVPSVRSAPSVHSEKREDMKRLLTVGFVALSALPLYAAEGAALSPFAGDFGNMFWTLVIFLIVVVLLGKFAAKGQANDVYLTPNRLALVATWKNATVQIVDLKEDVQHPFKPGEEIVGYRDLPELRRQLDYYLAHPDEARAIGENARRRALAEHTLRHRIDEMIATVNDRFGNFARASGPEAPRSEP